MAWAGLDSPLPPMPSPDRAVPLAPPISAAATSSGVSSPLPVQRQRRRRRRRRAAASPAAVEAVAATATVVAATMPAGRARPPAPPLPPPRCRCRLTIRPSPPLLPLHRTVGADAVCSRVSTLSCAPSLPPPLLSGPVACVWKRPPGAAWERRGGGRRGTGRRPRWRRRSLAWANAAALAAVLCLRSLLVLAENLGGATVRGGGDQAERAPPQ